MPDRVDPADFADSNVLGASDLNALPRGEIVNVQLTSDTSPTGSSDSILSDTFTLTDDRRIRFDCTVTLRSDTAGGIQCRMDLDGTQIQRKNSDAILGNSDTFISTFKSKNVAAGDHTIELIIGVSGSDGNNVHAVANGETGTHGVAVLAATDVGPQIS